MALNGFWPLLANAKPNTPALPSEICSATGLKHVGGGAPADSPDKSVRPTHCSLCPFNAERGAAIPVTAAPALTRTAAAAPKPEFFGAPRLESRLVPTALPRAPPFPS